MDLSNEYQVLHSGEKEADLWVFLRRKSPEVAWEVRVSPIHGTTTSRAEMQSLIMMMRLTRTDLTFEIYRVVMALDSQYRIAATEKLVDYHEIVYC